MLGYEDITENIYYNNNNKLYSVDTLQCIEQVTRDENSKYITLSTNK